MIQSDIIGLKASIPGKARILSSRNRERSVPSLSGVPEGRRQVHHPILLFINVKLSR
jgi:hypothetical protein